MSASRAASRLLKGDRLGREVNVASRPVLAPDRAAEDANVLGTQCYGRLERLAELLAYEGAQHCRGKWPFGCHVVKCDLETKPGAGHLNTKRPEARRMTTSLVGADRRLGDTSALCQLRLRDSCRSSYLADDARGSLHSRRLAGFPYTPSPYQYSYIRTLTRPKDYRSGFSQSRTGHTFDG